MTTFNPSDNYDLLKKQAYALYSLVQSKEQQIALLNSSIAELKGKLTLVDEKALEQALNHNAHMTELLIQAEEQIASLRQQLYATKTK